LTGYNDIGTGKIDMNALSSPSVKDESKFRFEQTQQDQNVPS